MFFICCYFLLPIERPTSHLLEDFQGMYMELGTGSNACPPRDKDTQLKLNILYPNGWLQIKNNIIKIMFLNAEIFCI